MGILFNPTRLGNKELAEIASIAFVQMARDGALDDVTIAEHPGLFPSWEENWTGSAGTVLMDEGALYRSVHDVLNSAQNTKPSTTPAMWTRIGNPEEEFPEWIQPIGAHDAYALGAKVSHAGKHWVSIADNNVWAPGVYGWEEA